MLTVVCSPDPGIGSDSPVEIASLLERLRSRPHRCVWIVPTKRRRRALAHDWLRQSASSAALLPDWHTLETFVAWALEHSPRQRPMLGGSERLLRLARIWQDQSGHAAGPGLASHLSRFVRDWQACGMSPPDRPRDPFTKVDRDSVAASAAERRSTLADPFEEVVQRYLGELEQDGRLDRMSAVRTLTAEFRAEQGWLRRLLSPQLDLVLFEGFHRLERAELELVAALSTSTDVLLWLVGIAGTAPGRSVAESLRFLEECGSAPRVIEHAPAAFSRLQSVGRSLFAANAGKPDEVAGLFRLEADSMREEVEAVAASIKEDYREAQKAERALALCDVAVVIPGPGYDPLIREIFPRAGLEFNLAGRALLVSTSRPARLLTAALELIHSPWRPDRFLDFLNLPLVKPRLQEPHRLAYLFEHRPRSRRQLGLRTWLDFWTQHLDSLARRTEAWQSGKRPLPDGMLLSVEQYVSRQRELCDSARRLLQSIDRVMTPVAALEAAIQAAPASDAPLSRLVDACVRLLESLDIEQWLAPPVRESLASSGDEESTFRLFNLEGVAVPWVEYEKDQQAYYRLLSILKLLRGLPAERVPRMNEPADPLAVLQLAWSGETYQIRTEDDAGVQVFEAREVRGLGFRHVYMLGLVDGQVPALPEEGMLAHRRRQIAPLARQLEQKEAESAYLFAQLFEAAQEKLVLSRPVRQEEQPTQPSRFLKAVQERASLAALPPSHLMATPRQAAFYSAGAPEETLDATLRLLRRQADAWHTRPDWPRGVHIKAPELLALLFPEQRSFNPSELETYAQCPFRFFGEQVLRLEERDAELARLLYGSLMHRVLQRFYVEIRKTADADGPLPAIQDRADLLHDIFQREWNQLDDGSVPPDLKRLFEHPQGVMRLFLDVMKEHEREHGNLLNEFVLVDDQKRAVKLGNDAQGRAVHVTGKIDRVDVKRDEPRQAAVLDYKTGKVKGASELTAKMEDGRMLQLPLYAAALQLLYPDLKVKGGAYIHLHEREESAGRALASAGSLKKKDTVPFNVDAAVAKALELVGLIRAGDFSLTRHAEGARYVECNAYCPLRHACRQPAGYRLKS